MVRHLLTLALFAAPAACLAAGTGWSPASWRAGVDGVGPIRLGMTLDQARKVSGVEWTEDPRDPGDDNWPACHYAWPAPGGQLQFDIGLMLEQGIVTRIDVAATEVATLSGARIGDTEGSVVEHYAGRAKPGSESDGTRILSIYPEQQRQMVFLLESSHISAYRVGQVPAVQYEEGCL